MDKVTQELKIGFVYFLRGYTAPKVFNGLYFECLLTDQKIAANVKISGYSKPIHIKDWPHEIYKKERFINTHI